MRSILPLAMVLLVIHAPGFAEEVHTSVQGISASLSKRGNVRYGPSTNSRIACTLDSGDSVEIIGPAPVADWFIIRFPQKGQAWVHEKNLQAIDGGKRWRVAADGTKARDDATTKGNIVADLNSGEIIDDRSASRGAWHAVYIPSAVAFVHKSVLNLPNAEAIAQQQAAADKIDRVWNEAQLKYAQLFHQLQAKPESAVSIDWSTLMSQLQEVSKEHPDAQVRSSAQRIEEGVAVVAEKSKAWREAHGEKALPPATPEKTVDETDPNTGKLHVPQSNQPTPVKPGAPGELPTPIAPSGGYTAVGFVYENTDYPKVGAPYQLLDGNSNVVAFLSVKGGSTVGLSEYFWRWVGVSGESKDLDQSLHGLDRKVPLIEVDSVQLIKK